MSPENFKLYSPRFTFQKTNTILNDSYLHIYVLKNTDFPTFFYCYEISSENHT